MALFLRRLSLVGNVSSEVSGNSTLFAEYLSYHFVHGNFQNTTSSSNQSCKYISISGLRNTNFFSPSSSAPTSSSSSSEASSTSSSSTTESSTSESASATTSAPSRRSLLGRIFRRKTSRFDSSSPQLESGIFPNTTVGRTLLNASELVQLPGNNSQVLAWTRNDENSNITILNQMYVFNPLLLYQISFKCSCDFHHWCHTYTLIYQVLILITVQTSLLSTLHSGVPYSSTKSTAY